MIKQLPGRRAPRWIRLVAGGLLTVVATIWMLALLPVLLFLGLLLAVMMIPVLRRLKREIEDVGVVDVPHRPTVDVTPWHRQVVNGWMSQAGRPSARGWGSAEGPRSGRR